MSELADLQAEEDAVNRECRKLLKRRDELRTVIAAEMGVAVLPSKRAQTPKQQKIERCPRCTARLGFCPACGAEFGAAA